MTQRRVAVIGAGPSGLYASHLAVANGWEVALFESHSKPGGCASFFRRKTPAGQAVFDAGATILNGFEPGSFLHRIHGRCQLPIKDYEPLRTLWFRLPTDRSPLQLEPARWTQGLIQEFGADFPELPRYLSRKEREARALTAVFEKVPHIPIENDRDLWRVIQRALPQLGTLAIPFVRGFSRSFADELASWGAGPRFRRWVDMNLLITLQARASEVHPLYGAMTLFFYPLGSGTHAGGMRALFEELLEALKSRPNARVFMRTPVTRIRNVEGAYVIETADGKVYGPFDSVLSSVPRKNTDGLLGRPLPEIPGNEDDVRWSAITSYLLVKDRPELPADAFSLHAAGDEPGDHEDAPAEGYFSFSARDNDRRAPAGHRTVTASTHVSPARWKDWDRGSESYRAAKAEAGARLVSLLTAAVPGIEILFAEHGTPVTFLRYTRRLKGSVGGLPLTYSHTFFRAPSQRTDHPNLLQIGDTAFPGQSILACAVGAAAAIEKLGGRVF